uniref:Hemolin n=1 Tax=Actias selene TaxID=37776 RepID=A0A1B1RSB4_9NEOP|nr:hemolin [Actias selene]
MAFKCIAVFSACIILSAAHPAHKYPELPPFPVLKDLPHQEVLFRENKPAVIECVIEGDSSSVKYSWHKEGNSFNLQEHNAVLGVVDGSLIFPKPQASDEGHYQCHVESPAGVASSRVISFKKTYLETGPEKTHEVAPVEGKPFQLDCPIPNGYPKPTITWKKTLAGSVPPSYDSNLGRSMTAGADGNLYITAANKDIVSEVNKYVCTAKNEAVDEEVILVQYSIKELAKSDPHYNGELIPQYLSKDIVAKAGTITMIYCMYGGEPLGYPNYFKDGKDVNGKPGDRVTRHNRSSGKRLMIQDTRPEDAGLYECKVDNGKGKPQEHSMKLTVISEPKFVTKPEKVMQVKVGEDVTIPCTVSGVPQSKVTWSQNAKTLSSGRATVTENGLVIKNVQKDDKAYYGCRATNEYGDIYSEVLVYVI